MLSALFHSENARIIPFRAENDMDEAFVVVVLGTNEGQVDLPAATADTPLEDYFESSSFLEITSKRGKIEVNSDKLDTIKNEKIFYLH